MLSRIIPTSLVFALAASAQVSSLVSSSAVEHDPNQFFPKPAFFRQVFHTPSPKVELRGPVRISEFVNDGKIEISVKQFLELVMANNTEIAISRLSVVQPKNAITRSLSIFDPLARASFNAQRATTPTTNQIQGADILSNLNQPYNFSYEQRLQSGTQINATFGGLKLSSNDRNQRFNPSYTSNFQMGFAQPLLRNRGGYVTRLGIMIARSNVRVSEFQLRDRVLDLVQTAENAYWNLVNSRETLKVQEKALEIRDQALKRAQRELELGAMSSLDIYQPQSEYAAAEIGVTQARFRVLQAEDTLRRQFGADLDPDLRKLPIIPTETVQLPTDSSVIDVEGSVTKAFSLRPDLKAAIQRLDVDDLTIKQNTNQLRPNLSLTGGYTSQGRGGTLIQQGLAPIPGGIGDAFSQVFGFDFPIYSVGFQLNFPIKNRLAAADLADSLVRKQQDVLTLRSTEQQVRLDVLQAVNLVESSKASVKLAVVFRDLAQKQLDAEQKKYELGTSQLFFVLQFGQRLIDAESTLVLESVNYRRNLLNLLRRTGELLDERGIVLQ